jgi:hypothetical protein
MDDEQAQSIVKFKKSKMSIDAAADSLFPLMTLRIFK